MVLSEFFILFVTEISSKESRHKTNILMIFSTVSLITQTQFRTGDIITTEDKLRF